ncbi:MAG: hypothetical protein EB051_05590 [Chlamydiia bacterium]|nr:hypothetical protein [Chlamydiia bacterium]
MTSEKVSSVIEERILPPTAPRVVRPRSEFIPDSAPTGAAAAALIANFKTLITEKQAADTDNTLPTSKGDLCIKGTKAYQAAIVALTPKGQQPKY